MSKFVHVLFHILMGAVQVANIASGIIPAPWNAVVAAAVGLIQAAVVAANHKPNITGASMAMKAIVVFLALSFLSVGAQAQAKPAHKNEALATKHSIKVGSGLKRTAHVFVKAMDTPVVGPGADLEASVDALGVSIQGVADALDLGVAVPLEALPKPFVYIGRGVHKVYQGLDVVGTFLAQ